MASISSVITAGFGPPGSASLVITDGFGIGEGATLSGRSRRRRRTWNSVLAHADLPTPALVAAERKIVLEMLLQAEFDQLIDERKILMGALDVAGRRQATQIATMIDRITRRVEDMAEDDDIMMLLI